MKSILRLRYLKRLEKFLKRYKQSNKFSFSCIKKSINPEKKIPVLIIKKNEFEIRIFFNDYCENSSKLEMTIIEDKTPSNTINFLNNCYSHKHKTTDISYNIIMILAVMDMIIENKKTQQIFNIRDLFNIFNLNQEEFGFIDSFRSLNTFLFKYNSETKNYSIFLFKNENIFKKGKITYKQHNTTHLGSVTELQNYIKKNNQFGGEKN